MARYKLAFPKPNEKQKLFLKERHKYVGFGGARGGGKSWVVRVKAILLALKFRGIKILIVRRTYPELRKNHIDPMRAIIPRAVARYNVTDKEFRFFNGSIIQFMYCSSVKDLDNYQGLEADVIFIDEATHHDEEVFKSLCACLRGVNGFPKRIYLTCNPGGLGHAWFKRLFIERNFNTGENPDDYVFIQSLATDNTALMRSQPEYLAQLDALPPKKRAAWRDGSWEQFAGMYFEELTQSPSPEIAQQLGLSIEELRARRMWTHVIEPFTPSYLWPRYRSFDWGSAKPFSCGWWTMDPDGRLYRILELYGCSPEEPNVGLKWPKEKVFETIREIEHTHPYLTKDEEPLPIVGVADPAIWQEDGGPSIADTAANYGIFFNKGDNKRIPGWMQVHSRLAFDEVTGKPMMYYFNTCKAIIRTMPLMLHSETIPEDLDTKGEDHGCDDVRYMCQLDPIKPRGRTTKFVPTADDPLDLHVKDKPDQYSFFRL